MSPKVEYTMSSDKLTPAQEMCKNNGESAYGHHFHDEYSNYLYHPHLWVTEDEEWSLLQRYWTFKKRQHYSRVIFVRIGFFYEVFHHDADVLHVLKGNPYMIRHWRARTGFSSRCLKDYEKLLTQNGFPYVIITNEEALAWGNGQSKLRQTTMDEYFQCDHDWIPQPRNMGEHTTYECSKCDEATGCP